MPEYNNTLDPHQKFSTISFTRAQIAEAISKAMSLTVTPDDARLTDDLCRKFVSHIAKNHACANPRSLAKALCLDLESIAEELLFPGPCNIYILCKWSNGPRDEYGKYLYGPFTDEEARAHVRTMLRRNNEDVLLDFEAFTEKPKLIATKDELREPLQDPEDTPEFAEDAADHDEIIREIFGAPPGDIQA